MTLIHLYRTPSGKLSGFSIIGHTGSAPQGEDIVCAGISAISQAAANALITVAGANPIIHIGEGYLSVRLNKRLDHSTRHAADIILRTAWQGFTDIAKAYAQYVKLSNQEVRKCFK